jgi:predicted DsbA family dithiol-disulfide isomerase
LLSERISEKEKSPKVEIFTSEHCHFCGIMEDSLKELQNFYNFDIKKVNVDITPTEGISKLPTIRINGAKEIVGYMSKEDLSNILVRQLYSKF